MQSIFEYTNYRNFLQDYYSWAKKNIRGFSHRAFLARAEMSGPNYLKRVMEGVHKLTDNSIPKFAKAMELSEKDANYFKYLVYFNQAKVLNDKDKYFEILMDLKSEHNPNLIEKDQYEYYKNWYNVAIREILSYFDYNDNPDALGKEISPPQSPRKVKQSLELLVKLDLIRKKPDGGYEIMDHAIKTGGEVNSLLIPKFHLAMAKLGVEGITAYKKADRYYSSLTMSASQEVYEDLIKMIREFRKKLAERVAEEPTPDRAYHLNLQLFPVSKPKSKKKK